MKKKLQSIINKQTLPIFSAIFLASLIFTIFISNKREEKTKLPIFSKYQLEEIGKSKSKIGYQKKKPKYVEDQVLIKYKEDDIKLKNSQGEKDAGNIRDSNSVKRIKSIKTFSMELVEITDGKSVEDKIEELKKDPNVEYAEPNYIKELFYTPNDTFFSEQWALHNVGQEVEGTLGTTDADMDVVEMWDTETDHSEDIIVAVLDTGVAINHPDLAENLVTGHEFDTNTNLPYDNMGHGTHIAGIIAAVSDNETVGISGISAKNNVKVMPLRFDMTTAQEILAIEYAENNGADIINMSFGGPYYTQAEYDAISNFSGLVVASAGNYTNDNDSTPFYPASHDLPNIISVAATDQNDELAEFSNYGANSVDVGAPGVSIYSTEGYRVFNEDFENVIKFSESGAGTNWGPVVGSSGDTWIITDTDYIASGSYANNIDSYLTSEPADIGSASHAYLLFDYDCGLPSTGYDYLGIEVYNGAVWTEIGVIDYTDTYYIYTDITQYKSSNFAVRFHWHTDASDNEYLGCVIDDVKIVDSSSSDGSYQFMDGTSMAGPYAAAVAAVIWGKNPSLTPAQVKTILLQTGDSIDSLSGVTLTGKRINANSAYAADISEIPEDPGDDTPISSAVTFHPDRRCHWQKPSEPTWVKLEKATKDGVSGMLLTWTQYGANEVNIKIDDGTGNYPWKIEKTSNDGHEFLANVASWQNIMIKPINHCKEGDYSQPVSFNSYPYGWYSVNSDKESASIATNTGSVVNNNVLGTTTEVTPNATNEEVPMVPETGSNDLILTTTSLAIVGFATYFILDEKSRKIALKGFEKKSSRNI